MKANLRNRLSEAELRKLYFKQSNSLEDIAKMYGVSRVAIYKYCKTLGLKVRSKSKARLQALKKGKLPHQYYKINENFFSKWTKEMAYVLGLIITDGCITPGGSISLSLNDKSLLEKVKKTLKSGHKITPSKHQKDLYTFNFCREKIIKDLRKFGIGPKKSLTVNFPEVPDEYLRDFIRGVFDGDGSVFYVSRKTKYPLITKFCGGSKNFILSLKSALESLGMPEKKLYCDEKKRQNPHYYFNYSHKDSLILFKIMYEGLKNDLHLKRKYDKFKAMIGYGKSA